MRKPKASPRHRAPYGAKARQFAVQCVHEAPKGNTASMFRAAAAALKAHWSPTWGPVPSHALDFVRRHWARWKSSANVKDRPRTGRPPKLPEKKAASAANLFTAGYTVSRRLEPKGPVITECLPFSSLDDALARCPALAAMRTEYGISRDTLWRHIRKADPTIYRSSVDYKRSYTVAEMAEREKTAQAFLKRLRSERDFVRRLVFVDEGSTILASHKHVKQPAWRSKRAPELHRAVGIKKLKHRKPIVLRYYIAVNADVGGVMIYPTTGTTDLKRLYVKNHPEPAEGFQVSARSKCYRCCTCASAHGSAVRACAAASFACALFWGCWGWEG